MPLVKSILLTELSKFADFESAEFVAFPVSLAEAASKWSTAINTYASTVIPVSTALGAKEAFEGIMLQMTTPGSGLALFPQAFTAYALSLGTGMAPAFIAVPPSIPIILDSVFVIGNGGGSSSDCLSLMADIIDLWFKTGTATPSGGGSPIFWA